MRRYPFIVLAMALLLIAGAETAEAAEPDDPIDVSSPPDNARYACVPSLMWRNPALCPNYGPGRAAYRVSSIQLSHPLPELPVKEFESDETEDILPHKYAFVKTLPLNVYKHPMEAAIGLPPVRTLLGGDWWVSLDGRVEYEGQVWYQINRDEFAPAEALALAGASRFQGVYLNEQPQHPFAWTNRWVQPAHLPQGEANTTVEPRNRYELITIFSEERRGDELWYLIGPDQWIEQKTVSRVDVDPPPEGVPDHVKWIEVDLFEQTIAAYEGRRMVYATMISSGRDGTTTPPGLYTVWAKIREGKMSHPDVEDGDPRFYYIEDVPWTLYFHEGYSIHAAFWHDAFGFTRSHGCVNLTPRDARWIFNWANPQISDGTDRYYIGDGGSTTWVWVHFTSPFE